MLIDNDLVFTKDYISTLLDLFYLYQDTDYGTVQTSYRYTPETPTETKAFAKKNRDKVHEGSLTDGKWDSGETWDAINHDSKRMWRQ